MRKTYKLLVSFILCFSLLLSSCGKSSVYEASEQGYVSVNAILGSRFDVPSSFLEQTTAITSLSEGTELDYDKPYMYKDGWRNYMLFQMNSLVILAKRGTEFRFDQAKSKSSALTEHGIGNTWFNPEGKRMDYVEDESNGIYKIITTVSAEVSITNNMYGNFVGKLAVIDYGDTEWTLFIGGIGDSYEEMSSNRKKIIDHVVKSFSLDGNVDMYLDGVLDIENMESQILSDENTLEIMGNQIVKEESSTTEVVISDILSIGEVGSITYMDQSAFAQDAAVIVDAIITGTDAEQFLKEQFEAGNIYRKDIVPPEGMHWNVVEYRITADPSENYIDVSMTGTDKEKLRYKGYFYSMRSYEVKNKNEMEPDGYYGKMYRYYAVPDGCNEYLICIGNYAATKDKQFNAYYNVLVE